MEKCRPSAHGTWVDAKNTTHKKGLSHLYPSTIKWCNQWPIYRKEKNNKTTTKPAPNKSRKKGKEESNQNTIPRKKIINLSTKKSRGKLKQLQLLIYYFSKQQNLNCTYFLNIACILEKKTTYENRILCCVLSREGFYNRSESNKTETKFYKYRVHHNKQNRKIYIILHKKANRKQMTMLKNEVLNVMHSVKADSPWHRL